MPVLVYLQNNGPLAVEFHPFLFPFMGFGNGGEITQGEHGTGFAADNGDLGQGLQ